jgi:hypothetical protein
VSRFASSALAALAVVVLAGPVLAEEAATTSFSHRMAQGRFLLDGGLPLQAMVEFQKASEMEVGRGNAEVHHLLARAAWQAGSPPVAMEAIRRAHALAGPRPDPELLSLHEFLTTRFAKVLVIGGSGSDARTPEPAVPLLDPELKRIFEAALAEIAAPQGGSTSVYLPVGAYRVGSHLIEVTAGLTTTMDLRPSVGVTAAGVYGEGSDSRGGGGSAPPALAVSHRAMVSGGGAGFQQQGDAAGSARLLVGWEPWLAEVAGLRVAFGVGALRLERIQEGGGTPSGVLLEGHVAAGALIPLPGDAAIGPWFGFNAGWSHTVDATLPDGYEGPVAYSVFGPDLSLRVVLPPQGPIQGGLEVGALFREFTPIAAPRDSDDLPHFGVGGGASFSLLIGGAS